jgi:hypothetical protein
MPRAREPSFTSYSRHIAPSASARANNVVALVLREKKRRTRARARHSSGRAFALAFARLDMGLIDVSGGDVPSGLRRASAALRNAPGASALASRGRPPRPRHPSAAPLVFVVASHP